MLTDWGIQWTVLGVLRQFYTFRENKIATKEQAANYGIHHFSSRWHPLIEDALNIRTGEKARFYHFRICRMVDNVRFLREVIQICNEDFQLGTRPTQGT